MLTISAQILLISDMVPPTPMEFSVLFFGVVLQSVEFIVW
jgi:hypothetical protein